MYQKFYQLSDKPFQLTPDPRFFYQSQGHKRALAYLRYGISQGEGFIIVTGGIGTGKTMLVRTLFNELDSANIVAGQIVSTQVGPEDILRVVSSTFGLPAEGLSKSTLLQNLENFLRAKHKERRRVLLVIDEVQNLPLKSLEELRMLSNIEANGRTLLQSFLLGQDEFRDTLQSPRLEQLRQRVIAAYHLGPLNHNETREYIEHRLDMVGWRDNPHFNEQAYEEIHNFTAGVPRRINALCDRLLLFGGIEEKAELGGDDVKLVAGEIEQELKRQDTPEAEQNDAVENAPSQAVAVEDDAASDTQSAGETLRDAQAMPEGSLEERVARLEKTVEGLHKLVKEERQLLRKAILLNLDLKDLES